MASLIAATIQDYTAYKSGSVFIAPGSVTYSDIENAFTLEKCKDHLIHIGNGIMVPYNLRFEF